MMSKVFPRSSFRFGCIGSPVAQAQGDGDRARL